MRHLDNWMPLEMREISTLRFVLRWYAGRFVFGVALLLVSAYGFINYSPSAVNDPQATLASEYGQELSAFGFLLGLGLVIWAWRAGKKLKQGA